jgi:BarA-like signal transduction histidine kinase
MAERLTLNTLESLGNETTFLTALNENFALIADIVDTLVSRQGDAPNTMSATLDMNANSIANVYMSTLPTSDPASAGQLWNDGGTVKVSAG